jgi:hypothetical protein
LAGGPRLRKVTTLALGRPRPQTLAPREHGAYAQLGLPLLVAHLSGAASWAGWFVTIAAVAAFLGHEPWLVLLGRRGARARDADEPRARVALGLAAGVTAVGGTAGFLVGTAPVRLALLACAGMAGIVLLVAQRGAERSLPGELFVAAALPALAVPVALSAGVDPARAVRAWLAFSLGGAASTFAVRDVIAFFKRGRSLRARLVPLVVSTGIAMLAGVAVPAAPMLLASIGLALRPPHPRHLRRVGWTLAVASVLTSIVLLVQ